MKPLYKGERSAIIRALWEQGHSRADIMEELRKRGSTASDHSISSLISAALKHARCEACKGRGYLPTEALELARELDTIPVSARDGTP
jgi:hypothetical protein